MNAEEIILLTRELGIRLYLKGGALAIKSPKGKLTQDLKSQISELKEPIIKILKAHEKFSTEIIAEINADIVSQDNKDNLLLSYAQERLWFIDQLENGSPEYNMPIAFRIKGDFGVNAAEQAIYRIIKRHHSLHTVFTDREGVPYQVIKGDLEFQLERYDLTCLTKALQTKRVKELVQEDGLKVFDLSVDIMIRASWIQLSDKGQMPEGILLFNMHHIASDGWSIGLLVTEFIAQYQAAVKGEADPLTPLNFQYADYALWQRNWLQGEVLDSQLNYWKRQLADLPLAHSLVLDYARPETKQYAGETVANELSSKVSRALKQIAKDSNVTVFMLLHAALGLVLSRHSNSRDIVIGTPVANRTRVEFESLIGFFVNTLVLRVDTRYETFGDYLSHVRLVNLDAQNNQDVPFEQVVESCQVSRNAQHTPLFQIMFSLSSTELSELNLPDLYFSPIKSSDVTVKFDLDINAQVTEEGILFSWIYDKSLFSREHIQSLSEHLNCLLVEIASSPKAKLCDLSMLSAKETSYLIHELNRTQTNYPRDKLIHELFAAQAEINPGQVALIFGKQQLTYRELNEASNQLAHHLREKGVDAENLVGLCVERSFEMVIGILGILKAGGAYVPLDPNYPAERLEYMLTDTGLKYLLTQSGLTNGLNLPETLDVIELNGEVYQQRRWACPLTNPVRSQVQAPSNLAYVIYTSGSTGQPKGVLQTHENVARLFGATEHEFRFNADDVWTLFHSINFDFSVWELWGALVYGGTLLIPSYQDTRDPEKFVQLCEQRRVSILNQTPGAFKVFSEAALRQKIHLPALRFVVFGGEALQTESLLPWWDNYGETQPQFVNMYGITETTVHVTYKSLSRVDLGGSSIGRRLSDQRILLLDSEHNPVPFRAAGELYVGGAGLARGYLNQPGLTAERFIQNPFNDDPDNPNDRLYRTGDLVRYLEDGNLAFVGRVDEQVKIRGFRIELGEIEYQLSQGEGVSSSLVLARENEPGHKHLVAYVVVEDKTVNEKDFARQLSARLQKSLPDYMLPSAFVVVEQFPLTPNGKIDKQQLPAPDGVLLQDEYVAPETDTEKALVEIWAKLLKLDPQTLSATANFFELGGHSLLIIKLIAEIRSHLAQELPVKTIFDYPELGRLAIIVDTGVNSSLRRTVTPVTRQGNRLPLSFAQQRLWFIDRMEGGSPEYNMPLALSVKGAFDIEAAEQAIIRIIRRHEPLRTIFSEGEDGPVQVIQAAFDFQLTYHDLCGLDKSEQASTIKKLVQQNSDRPFDLSADLMVRAAYLHLAGQDKSQQGILLFNMHHIASDGWSMGLLTREFITQYQAVLNAEPDPLRALPVQYADYAHWQRNWLQDEVLAGQLGYWQTQLAEVPEVHSLPLDYARGEQKKHTGGVLSGSLSGELSQRLQQLARVHEVTPFMLLHAAIGLVLSRHSNSRDIVIGTPLANRMQKELEPLIGFFVNTLVLRTDTGFEKFRDYLAHVRQVNLDAQDNQDVPFEHLVEHCNVSRSTQHTPLFQIMFSMDTNEAVELNLPVVDFTRMEGAGAVAKFDLNINARVTEEGIALSWIYDKSLFKRATIERLNDHLERLLQGIAESPEARISDLPMLSTEEIDTLVHKLNDTRVAYPRDKLIHELFEAQAETNSGQVALVFENQQLTYRELNEASNQLAHYLIKQGVRPDTLVGLCVERSLEMIIGIFGILKAGGAYLPLEPSYPKSRLRYMLSDSCTKYILSQSGLTVDLALPQDIKVIELDTETVQRQLKTYSTSNIDSQSLGCTTSQLAYVIYTSGSTGQPKGVLIEHRNIGAYKISLEAQFESLGLKTFSPWLWSASFAFDASVKGLLCLLMGRSVIVASEMDSKDPKAMVSLIQNYEIEVYNGSPHIVALLLESLNEESSGLPHLIVSGEQIPETIFSKIISYCDTNDREFINAYGPTETTINSTFALIDNKLSIGQPISNTVVYILDDHQCLVPEGRIGELYIGGAGLARGYLNQAVLTREKFIDAPFSVNTGERLYKTGDLVRYLPTGNLEFIGRIDEQIKIRGFRIELGEIEYQLSQCEGIRSSIVLVSEGVPGQKRLIAYVILKDRDTVNNNELFAHLRHSLQSHLPDYMLPSVFVIVEEFPLTPNGKIDTKRLPAPDGSSLRSEYVAAETEIEKRLVEIWAELLKLDLHTLSITANFFELGGHSLLIINLITQIKIQFGIELSVKKIFELKDIKNMAEEIVLINLKLEAEKKSNSNLDNIIELEI